MAEVGEQEDLCYVDLTASSSLMEALCMVPIDVVGHGCRGEDKDHIAQGIK